MQFQNPWGALAFLLLVPLILLYLLRQRHREITVPSTMLWQQVLTQWEAAHPWQKWRRNLLFFLQLLVICLLALALMRPVWRTAGAGQNSIIIVDLSMSMQAEENGRTRIDRAKEAVRDLTGQIQQHEEVSLILSGRQNELLLSKTLDRDALVQIVEQADAWNGGSRLDEALQMAASMLDPDHSEVIHVFTDHDPAVYNDQTIVHNVALGAENTAITNVSHSRSSDGSLNVLGLLHNFGQAKTVQVELWGDGALLDIRACDLAADSSGNVLFEGLDSSLRHIMLALSDEDALQADNRAWLVVRDSETYRVLLQTERNVFLEKAIGLRDDIELYKTGPSQEMPPDSYSLIIGDGWSTREIPENRNLWIIAPQTNTDWFALQDMQAEGEIRVSGTGDSLLRYVDLSGLRVANATTFDLRDAQTTVLAYLDDQPLMILQDDGIKRLAFGFDFHDSNLPLQKDFPILVQNTLEWFLPVREGQTDRTSVGNSILIALQSDTDHYQVRLPDGSLVAGLTRPQFEETRQPGFYTVTQFNAAGEEVETAEFAVNVSAAQESELRTAGVEAETRSGQLAELWRRWNLWPYLILCTLVLMVLEWWVYHRGA